MHDDDNDEDFKSPIRAKETQEMQVSVHQCAPCLKACIESGRIASNWVATLD